MSEKHLIFAFYARPGRAVHLISSCRLYTAAFIILLMLTCICARQQERPGGGGSQDDEWWAHDFANPNNEGLVFKARWFNEQTPSFSEMLEVYCNGRAYRARVSVMGTGPSGFTILTPQQVDAIKQIISDLNPPAITNRQGQLHTAVIFLSDGKYVRRDYRGTALPYFVSKINSIAEAGASSPEYPFEREADPRLLSPPEGLGSCVGGDKNIDLESLSKDELLKRAFHRYLYPAQRYSILKVYLRRFPNETDDLTRLIKRWAAAYEKARK
jgi:hypothetical protein